MSNLPLAHLPALLGRQRDATEDLAGFVRANQPDASFLHPRTVLFNDGVFKSALLAERTLGTLNGWLAAEGAAPTRVLAGADTRPCECYSNAGARRLNYARHSHKRDGCR